MKRAALACLATLPFLVACDGGGAASAEAVQGTLIDCSLNGAGGFGRDCAMQRVEQDGTSYIVVRHPDGAFRRFELGARGLVTADGADRAEITDRGGYVEVRVSSDRYHLPVSE